MMQISKPHIVDLLRIFDRKKWIRPRIRYASRSKPELIKDIKKYFFMYGRDDVLHLKPRNACEKSLCHIPLISYDFSKKRYLFDGKACDVPAESRKKVRFSISHVPVTMTFFPVSGDPPSTGIAAVSSQGSP